MHIFDKATSYADYAITSYVLDAGPGNEPRFENPKFSVLLLDHPAKIFLL